MAVFCGVSVHTVTTWLFRKKTLPIAVQLLKLLCFLDAQGYRIIELERAGKERRGFIELIGFGVLSVNQASALLGYAYTSHINNVLLGHEGCGRDKQQKMWNIWKSKREELEQKKKELQRQLQLESEVGTEKPTTNTKQAVASTALTVDHQATLKVMEGLLALMSKGSFDRPSPEALAELLKSSAVIFPLSAHLSNLSSQLMMLAESRKGGDGGR